MLSCEWPHLPVVLCIVHLTTTPLPFLFFVPVRSLLLIEFVASTASENDVKNAIARKDKSKLPLPVSSQVVAPAVGLTPLFPFMRSSVVGGIGRQKPISCTP